MAKGDRIYTYRNFWQLDGLYKHYGIDCGDGTVIHYRKPSEVIERTSMATFSMGNPVYVVDDPEDFYFVPDVVVERAESRLGEKKYNLLFNNCEHFVNWCKIGINDSKQIRNFLPTINRLDTSQLYEPIKQALMGKDKNNSLQLLDEALTDVRSVWNTIQPEYERAISEMKTWDEVAKAALKKDREDLARAALKKKWNYRHQAGKLEIELNELAELTENIIRNQQSLKQ
ncbi:lecithin retinol acyltransferase family protein [Myxosarcina sp. GI1]|uniref:lecithin retinol acyltransferase family protein n=1 Tax=Myxosarcina sp. GI1 TaxID=1541065 RepID=UPI00055F3FDC|nr:lecithin retinol acyltransferase family protein [Myxosarcina sp. GI1]